MGRDSSVAALSRNDVTELLERVMEPLLSIGASAPEFSAQASDGKTYTLGELLRRGPVALFFYPGNNTPG